MTYFAVGWTLWVACGQDEGAGPGPNRPPVGDDATDATDATDSGEEAGIGDPCTCDGQICYGTTECGWELVCIGSAYLDSQTCAMECTEDEDCPDGLVCATWVVDTVDLGEYCG